MWETRSEIEIAAPIKTVYEYLADFTRHSEWSTGVAELAPTSGGPMAVGAEFEAHEVVPVTFTTYTRITALEPSQRIAWEGWDGQMMKVHWVFELNAQNGRTRLVQRARFEPATLLGRIILTVMRKRQVPKENAQSLARIKAILEKQ